MICCYFIQWTHRHTYATGLPLDQSLQIHSWVRRSTIYKCVRNLATNQLMRQTPYRPSWQIHIFLHSPNPSHRPMSIFVQIHKFLNHSPHIFHIHPQAVNINRADPQFLQPLTYPHRLSRDMPRMPTALCMHIRSF